MRILFTGATGVVGRIAVPKLAAAGHEVDAVYRADADRQWLEGCGANPIQLDLFDPDAVRPAVSAADVVVHFATSIPAMSDMKKRSSWSTNDRLRIEATSNLVDAALAGSTSRFIQESITFTYADGGDGWIDESHAIQAPWEVTESALAAEREVERFSASGGAGISLRMAGLYGPGDASREYIEAVKLGRMPIIGAGSNYLSSLATVDAAGAVAASMTAAAGVYNVADDEPVTAAESLSTLAEILGVRRPRRVPRWVARMVVGAPFGLLTRSHRIDNAKFKAATGWAPTHRSVVDGWAHVLAMPEAA